VPRHAGVMDTLAGDLHHADAIGDQCFRADAAAWLDTTTQSRFLIPFSLGQVLAELDEELGLELRSHGSHRLIARGHVMLRDRTCYARTAPGSPPRAMSRWLPWLAELQPELFIELGKDLAKEKGIRISIGSWCRAHAAASARKHWSPIASA